MPSVVLASTLRSLSAAVGRSTPARSASEPLFSSPTRLVAEADAHAEVTAKQRREAEWRAQQQARRDAEHSQREADKEARRAVDDELKRRAEEQRQAQSSAAEMRRRWNERARKREAEGEEKARQLAQERVAALQKASQAEDATRRHRFARMSNGSPRARGATPIASTRGGNATATPRRSSSTPRTPRTPHTPHTPRSSARRRRGSSGSASPSPRHASIPPPLGTPLGAFQQSQQQAQQQSQQSQQLPSPAMADWVWLPSSASARSRTSNPSARGESPATAALPFQPWEPLDWSQLQEEQLEQRRRERASGLRMLRQEEARRAERTLESQRLDKAERKRIAAAMREREEAARKVREGRAAVLAAAAFGSSRSPPRGAAGDAKRSGDAKAEGGDAKAEGGDAKAEGGDMMEEAEPATATEHAGAACLSTVSAVSAVSSQASAGALFAAAQRAAAASKAMEEARKEDQKALAALRLAQQLAERDASELVVAHAKQRREAEWRAQQQARRDAEHSQREADKEARRAVDDELKRRAEEQRQAQSSAAEMRRRWNERARKREAEGEEKARQLAQERVAAVKEAGEAKRVALLRRHEALKASGDGPPLSRADRERQERREERRAKAELLAEEKLVQEAAAAAEAGPPAYLLLEAMAVGAEVHELYHRRRERRQQNARWREAQHSRHAQAAERVQSDREERKRVAAALADREATARRILELKRYGPAASGAGGMVEGDAEAAGAAGSHKPEEVEEVTVLELEALTKLRGAVGSTMPME